MRPLRFRAWDRVEKKIVTGKHACNLHGEVFFLYGFGAMAPHGRSAIDYVNDIDFHQFTGCVDVDGNELYEGDVIESFSTEGHSIKHLIWFHDGSFVAVQPENDDVINGFGVLKQSWLTECEKKLIGNIYENPELDIWDHQYL